MVYGNLYAVLHLDSWEHGRREMMKNLVQSLKPGGRAFKKPSKALGHRGAPVYCRERKRST